MQRYKGHPEMNLADPATQPEFYEAVAPKRFFAWIIDTVLIFLLSLLIVPFTGFLALFVFGALMFVTGFFYRLATLAAGSATPGMRLMAIEFRDASGARFDGGTAFLHTVGFFVSTMIFPLQIVSAILMLTSARGQGLTDHILGTVAMNRRRD
jgi:uncharacterized RDD family membrane protein YckC